MIISVNKYSVDISIIIVSWNVRDLLRECINSIYEKTKGITFEIVVVDNASSDGTVDMVRTEFPHVKLFVCDENLGFARANNLALPLTAGKYIGLLNPDTELLNNAFVMMIAKLEDEPTIGITGPKILASDGRVEEPCARNFITLISELQWLLYTSRRTTILFSNYLPKEQYNVSQPVECISGACMVLRRDALLDGLIFDPQFFMYFEDLDLCYEIKLRGRQVFYLSEALVAHHKGKSAKQVPVSRSLYTIKAAYRFFVKRYGKLTGFFYRCLCVAFSAMKLAITWLVRLNPRFRFDPLWMHRSVLYPQMIRCALYIED